MTPKINKGMWLCQQKDTGNSVWLLSTAGVLAASVSLILTTAALMGFDVIYSPWVMALAGACLCVLHGFMKRMGQQGWFYLGALLALLLVVILFHFTCMHKTCMVM